VRITFADSGSFHYEGELEKIVGVLETSNTRVRALILSNAPSRVVSSILQRLHYPILESLSITVVWEDDSTPLWALKRSALLSLPRLHTISLSSAPVHHESLALPFPSLRRLNLVTEEIFTPAQGLAIIKMCPELEELGLKISDDDGENQTYEHVTQRNIVSVFLITSASADNLLNNLTLPATTSLTIRAEPGIGSTSAKALVEFLGRSQCLLRMFRMTNDEMMEKDLIQIIEHMPLLEVLELKDEESMSGFIGTALLERLSELVDVDGHRRHVLTPSLRQLVFVNGNDVELDCRKFWKLMQSRQGCTSLATVYIHTWPLHVDDHATQQLSNYQNAGIDIHIRPFCCETCRAEVAFYDREAIVKLRKL
jgi:hypothetical protein